MNIFKLLKPTNTYDIIDLDIVSMTKQIVSKTNQSFDKVLISVMDGIPRGYKTLFELSEYGFDCKHNVRAKKQNYDVNLYGNLLVLNTRAYGYLNEAIKSCGEFSPLRTDGEKLFLFNPLEFVQEDLSLTEKAYLDGFENGLKSLVFERDDINDKLLFKSKLQGGLSIYCTDAFKELLADGELKGLIFNKDISRPILLVYSSMSLYKPSDC
ncbi:hypothetical protein [Pseudocolwellia sp. HL-MZ7]|uniref:hypothetical protein n=1 Tax=Pseudocolwellia sp. HL-MZ7 TaxID=3400627 RepID=UPI003CFB1A2C